MHRRTFLSLSVLSMAGCAHLARSTNARTLAAHVERELPALMAEHNVPGVGVAIVEHGSLLWRGAFGVKDAESAAQVDYRTLFQVGSMSKPVFAYFVLNLCEKGFLHLDKPFSKLAPIHFLDDPRVDKITPRHVLTHTSGFQNWRSDSEPLSIHFEPGTKWLYSGEGYFYLQSVITHLLGRFDESECGRFESQLSVCASDFGDLMQRHLLHPMGMKGSGYSPAGTDVARGHDKSGRGLPVSVAKRSAVARYGAAGGLFCTAEDFAQFLIEVLKPSKADEFRLRQETIAEMLRPEVTTGDTYGSQWALGWQITKSGLFQHGGDNPGFHSFALASKKLGNGFVILTNGDDGPAMMSKVFASKPLADFFATERV